MGVGRRHDHGGVPEASSCQTLAQLGEQGWIDADEIHGEPEHAHVA
jgi:hypothetical protein